VSFSEQAALGGIDVLEQGASIPEWKDPFPLRRLAPAWFALGALSAGAVQGLSFQPAVEIPVGNGPEAIAAANLRTVGGDDVLDLAVANGGSDSISVLLGNGDGSFNEAVTYSVGGHPWFISVADLNGDNLPDLVVSNRDSSDVTVLMGAGDGLFQSAGAIPLSGSPFSTGVGDFNSDGFQDLVVTNLASTFLLLGKGDGTFHDPRELDAGANTRFVAVGDFNRDKFADLAVTNALGTDTVTILFGDGAGHFERVRSLAVG
jgi:hypothetical protein